MFTLTKEHIASKLIEFKLHKTSDVELSNWASQMLLKSEKGELQFLPDQTKSIFDLLTDIGLWNHEEFLPGAEELDEIIEGLHEPEVK